MINHSQLPPEQEILHKIFYQGNIPPPAKSPSNFFAILPAKIRHDANLTSSSKVLYAEITALQESSEFCWATNAYLAELLSLKVRQIQYCMIQLKNNGYIYVQEFPGKSRRIYLCYDKFGAELKHARERDKYLNSSPEEEKAKRNLLQGCSKKREACSTLREPMHPTAPPYINNTMNNTNEELQRVESALKKEEQTLELWNKFCKKNLYLIPIRALTSQRRSKLKQRFKEEHFDFRQILNAAYQQNFLLGDNDRKWVISYDWLIKNSLNYMKVLEMQYNKNQVEEEGQRL